MLKIDNLTKIYKNKQNSVVALNNISIELPETGLVFINGASGSGKTTLMNILAGLDSPTEGEMFLDDKNISKYSEREWDSYRNTMVGIVFQSFNLAEDMTVEENILMPLKIQKRDIKDYKSEVKKALEYVGLKGYEKRKNTELSAGQMQRVAIARAIIKKPRIILADEATGNLDPMNTTMILNLFNDISKNCLVILISHDRDSAEKYGDRIISLADGEIVKDIDNTKIKNLYRNPYEITIKTEDREETKDLDCFDIKEEIAGIGKWENNICGDMSFEISVQSKKVKTSKEMYEKWTDKLSKPQNMPLKDLLRNSLKNIRKKKIRTAITILLIAFICMVFIVINICAYNDYIYTLYNYFLSEDKDTVFIAREVVRGEEDDAYQKTIFRGTEFMEDLERAVGNENIIKLCEMIALEYGEDGISDINLCVYRNNGWFDNVTVEGSFPYEDNQVVLNKIYNEDIYLGDTVLVDGVECEVVGFTELFIPERNEYYGIVSQNVPDEGIRRLEKINLQGFNIIASTYKSEFPNSAVTISSVSALKKYNSELLYGRYPENDGEVIVSGTYAEEMGDYSKNEIIVKYHIPDMNDKKYNGYYDDCFNMYDYTGRNVTVVGVYDSESVRNIGKIVFTDAVYNNIIEDYIKSHNYMECMVYIKNGNYNIIKNLIGDNYFFDDEKIKTICSFMDTTDKLKDILNISIMVACFMIIVVLVLFFSYNVKDHSKKIGILRAIGVRSTDIYKMFMIEVAVICITAMILTMLLSKLIVALANYKIQDIVGLEGVAMLNMNVPVCTLWCIAVFIIGLIVTAIPIFRMTRSKSITLINMEN